ncbi:hypothetical protein [Caudoviricetes sp.]|nr:hypothetical protein [Caudoviricetes sp.]
MKFCAYNAPVGCGKPSKVKTVRSGSDPVWGVTVSKGRWFSTGVCSNGFFVFHLQPPHRTRTGGSDEGTVLLRERC